MEPNFWTLWLQVKVEARQVLPVSDLNCVCAKLFNRGRIVDKAVENGGVPRVSI